MTSKQRAYIGTVQPSGAQHLAKCSECTWQLRKRIKQDAMSLLNSHYRIAHHPLEHLYLQD